MLEKPIKVTFTQTKIRGWDSEKKEKEKEKPNEVLGTLQKKISADVKNFNFSLMWNSVSSQTDWGFSFNCSVQAVQRSSGNFSTEISKGPMETAPAHTSNAPQLHSESSSQTNSFSLV